MPLSREGSQHSILETVPVVVLEQNFCVENDRSGGYLYCLIPTICTFCFFPVLSTCSTGHLILIWRTNIPWVYGEKMLACSSLSAQTTSGTTWTPKREAHENSHRMQTKREENMRRSLYKHGRKQKPHMDQSLCLHAFHFGTCLFITNDMKSHAEAKRKAFMIIVFNTKGSSCVLVCVLVRVSVCLSVCLCLCLCCGGWCLCVIWWCVHVFWMFCVVVSRVA